MADPNMSNDSSKNQTAQSDQGRSEIGGGDRQREQGGLDKSRSEGSAIGGGDRSQTGEPGRARNELDQNKGQTGQNSESGMSRNETAGQR